MIISLFFAFLFAGNINANQAVTSHEKKGSEVISMQKDHNSFKTIKTKINTKVNNIKQNIKDLTSNLSGGLRNAILLMAIGLVLIIVGSYITHLVVAIGAIIFLIGAIFLILELI